MRCSPRFALLSNLSLTHRFYLRLFAASILALSSYFVTPGGALAQTPVRGQEVAGKADEDDAIRRSLWNTRGREVGKGESVAALRLRAHQQKLAMRAAREAAAAKAGLVSSTPWVGLGPAPLASDATGNGGQDYNWVSGRATSVVIDPADATGNTVYLGGAYGGLWRSTNAGSKSASPSQVSWTPLMDTQPTLAVGAIALQPGNSNLILVGSGETNASGDSYYGMGIFRSTDGGTTWTQIPSAASGQSFLGIGFSKMAFSTANTNLVVATAAGDLGLDFGLEQDANSTARGIYYSTDAGATWNRVSLKDGSTSVVAASATGLVYNAKQGAFYAAVRRHGVYSSTDGINFTRLATQPTTGLSTTNCPATSNSGNCPIYRAEFTVTPGRNEMYTWIVDINSFGAEVDDGIWQTTNGGSAWSSIPDTGITNCGSGGGNERSGTDQGGGCGASQGVYNLELAAIPSAPPNASDTDLYAGAINIYKCHIASGKTACSTIDAGVPNDWINLTHVYGCRPGPLGELAHVHPDQHALAFLVVNGGSTTSPGYFAHDGGISRTLDGYAGLKSGTCTTSNQFDSLAQTLGSMTEFLSFSVHPTSADIMVGGTQDNGSPKTATATTSSTWQNALGGDGGFNAINPNASTDGIKGDEWFTSNPGSSIWFCESGTACNDFSANLEAQPGFPTTGNIDQGPFYTNFILDPLNPADMLIGTCRVWRGTTNPPNGPGTFAQISVNFDTLTTALCTGSETNQVAGLAAGGPKDSSNLSSVVYATTWGYGPLRAIGGGEVWSTTNAAAGTFTNVTGSINPKTYAISSVAIDPADATGKTAYVGIMGFHAAHVFKTTNAGTSWTDWTGAGGTALPDSPVTSLLVDSGTVYAGTDVGVFSSSGGAGSWTEVGPAASSGVGYLPSAPVTALRIFSSGATKLLRASTYGRGIWQYNLAQASYSLSANPSSVSIAQSSQGTSTITVTSTNGFNSAVALSASGQPSGVTVAFNPTSVTPPANGSITSTMTMTVGATVATGNYTITVTGTSGGTTQTTTVTLTVTAGPGFTLSAAPSTLTVTQATSNTSTISVTDVGGFSGNVTLAASGLPAGVTAAFSPNPTATTSTLTFTASATATTGTSTVTITGTSGALTAQTTISLTVAPPFSLSAAPSSVTITPTLPGGTTTITVALVSGSSGNVTLSASALPTGVTAAFNPNPVVTGNTSTLTLTAAANAVAGASTITIGGTGLGVTETTTITLTVTPPPDFSLSASPASVSIVQAVTTGGTSTVTITPSNGFTGSVTFTAAVPSGVTAAFNPNPSTGTTTVTLVASSSAAATQSTVTITGTSGALTHTTQIALTVVQNVNVPAVLTNPAAAHPGQSTTTTMTLAPYGGGNFTQNVTYSCLASSLPAGTTCSFSPASINSGTGQTTVTITLQTAGPFAMRPGLNLRSQNQRLWIPLSLPLAGIVFAGLAGKRIPRLYQVLGMCLMVAFAGFLVACGNSNPSVVSVTPGSVNTLYPSLAGAPAQTQQFTASVSNTTDQTVTWAVSGGSANGSISSSGLYTAPATLPNPNSPITVTATSSHTSSPGQATVTLKAPTPAGTTPITVVVTEGSDPAQNATFNLTVN